ILLVVSNICSTMLVLGWPSQLGASVPPGHARRGNRHAATPTPSVVRPPPMLAAQEAGIGAHPTALVSHPSARRAAGRGPAAAGCQLLSHQLAPGRPLAAAGSLCCRAHGSGLEAGGAVRDAAQWPRQKAESAARWSRREEFCAPRPAASRS